MKSKIQKYNQKEKSQLRMVLSATGLANKLEIKLPKGFKLRNYQQEDKQDFFELMHKSTWPEWNQDKLDAWKKKIVNGGWFMIEDEATGKIVATSMALNDPTDWHPKGGQFGWIAVDPEYRKNGLGTAVSGAALNRLKELGYKNIHLGTEDYRLPAIKIYLKIGMVPVLYDESMAERWMYICNQLHWPFTPNEWN